MATHPPGSSDKGEAAAASHLLGCVGEWAAADGCEWWKPELERREGGSHPATRVLCAGVRIVAARSCAVLTAAGPTEAAAYGDGGGKRRGRYTSSASGRKSSWSVARAAARAGAALGGCVTSPQRPGPTASAVAAARARRARVRADVREAGAGVGSEERAKRRVCGAEAARRACNARSEPAFLNIKSSAPRHLF